MGVLIGLIQVLRIAHSLRELIFILYFPCIDLDLCDDDIGSDFGVENIRELETVTQSTKSEESSMKSLEYQQSKKRRIIPRVLGSDIRRHYPHMLINILNANNIDTMYGFFNTFMRKDSLFTIDQRIYANLGVPSRMQFQGPIQVAHYLLGLIVMIPDIVVHMHSHKIITSTEWKGTKVILQLEYEGTKLSDLDMVDWVPPLDSMSEI